MDIRPQDYEVSDKVIRYRLNFPRKSHLLPKVSGSGKLEVVAH